MAQSTYTRTQTSLPIISVECLRCSQFVLTAHICTQYTQYIQFNSFSLNMSKTRMERDFSFYLFARAFFARFCSFFVLFNASSTLYDRTCSAHFYILHARHAIVPWRWSHHARAMAINVPWFNLSTPFTICDMQIKFWHIFAVSVCECAFLLILRCFVCKFTLSIRYKANILCVRARVCMTNLMNAMLMMQSIIDLTRCGDKCISATNNNNNYHNNESPYIVWEPL